MTGLPRVRRLWNLNLVSLGAVAIVMVCGVELLLASILGTEGDGANIGGGIAFLSLVVGALAFITGQALDLRLGIVGRVLLTMLSVSLLLLGGLGAGLVAAGIIEEMGVG